MLDYLYGAMIVFLWIGLLGGPLLLLVLRGVYVLTHHKRGVQRLKILFLPCSIGFFLEEKDPTRLKRVYEWLLTVNFVFLFLGSLFLFYLQLL